MIKDQQAARFLQQLKLQYPAAFKRNYLLYSMMKTKGLLDNLKELIPWLLAAMIFVSISMSLGAYLENAWPDLGRFRAQGLAVLSIMLFFMLITPIVIKQMKHSSVSLYRQLRHTPAKLAGIILLQAINIAYIESSFLQSLLFILAMNFGFVRFYKENLFREHSSSHQRYYLQETRRVCFWSYKQVLKTQCRLFFSKRGSAKAQRLKPQLERLQQLHADALRFEQRLCKSLKHADVETYLDGMMK